MIASIDAKLPAVSRKQFSVAPMKEWTDRHCRVFHRSLTRYAVLYTEMVTARSKACKAKSRFSLLLTAQPMTRRACRSIITAKYNQPSAVQI